MEEPNRFQKLVAEAKKNIKEISSNDAALELGCGAATLIDVRSDEDWKAEHARGAKHLNRGEIEVEIEEQVPDLDQRIICYCGGGSRSALVAESLQKMGYRNVRSMTGGFREWKAAGLPTAVDYLCHPERSAVESKDRAKLAGRFRGGTSRLRSR